MYQKLNFSINLTPHASAKTNCNTCFLHWTFFSTSITCKGNSDIIDKIIDFSSLLDKIWFYTKMLNVKVIDNININFFLLNIFLYNQFLAR